jgi:hypothetical protein
VERAQRARRRRRGCGRGARGQSLATLPLRDPGWRDGVIPDVAEAVESPKRLSDDPGRAWELLDLVRQVPTPVWGRDELRTGEMWNSNSLISWLITRSSLDVDAIHPPTGGRAPGWHAGVVIARRQLAAAAASSADIAKPGN